MNQSCECVSGAPGRGRISWRWRWGGCGAEPPEQEQMWGGGGSDSESTGLGPAKSLRPWGWADGRNGWTLWAVLCSCRPLVFTVCSLTHEYRKLSMKTKAPGRRNQHIPPPPQKKNIVNISVYFSSVSSLFFSFSPPYFLVIQEIHELVLHFVKN